MHSRTGIHPHWDFNETVYDSCTWTIEPTESLNELYRQRAEQIRNRYDYLVLMYSSGADSDNMLHSFLDNSIILDEIASFVNYEATGDAHDHWFNGEIYDISIPKLKEKCPHIKHRLVDISQLTLDYFSNPSTKFDWIYSMNSIFNPNTTVRNYLRNIVNDWKDLINSGKKVGFIWGTDKPRIHIVDGKFCFRFIDIIDNAVNPDQQRLNIDGHYDEFFYWTPDMPSIVIKQAHIIKNYLSLANEKSAYMSLENSGLGYKFIDNKKYSISTVGVHQLIYPNFEYRIQNDNKPPTLFYPPRDKWFMNLSDSDIAKTSWEIGLKQLWKTVPDYWKNDPTDPLKAFKQCLSKPYFLE